MKRLGLASVAALLACVAPAAAHTVPFSFVDVRVRPEAVEVTVVAHVYDLSHDLGLGVETPDRLLDIALLDQQAQALIALIGGRMQIAADGRTLVGGPWTPPEPLPDRQAIGVSTTYPVATAVGMVAITADFFPYDPEHQTFVNVYEGEALMSQAILGRGRDRFEYFAGTPEGTLAVVRRFVPAGMHHILVGPDHLLFLVGLLLLGGSIRQLAMVVTAFTVAHSITLSLAALNLLAPPARLVEPAIALSIIYVGADNLMVKNGKDVRGWIAFAFGFIHGFGFAGVLREMDLPRQALGWSLFSFNVGVEVGQLCVVAVVASILAMVRARSADVGRRLAFVGSLVVMAAGTYWFVQRVFFSGGMT